MSLPVVTPASGSQMMSSTWKVALAVFCEYDAQVGVAELHRERDALKKSWRCLARRWVTVTTE